MTSDDHIEIVKRKVQELSEFFDGVQILATYCDDEGTHFVSWGGGNWYARQGMAHKFINQDVAEEIGQSIKTSNDE